MLAQRESTAMAERKAQAAERFARQEQRELELQDQYKGITTELADARKAIAALATA